MNGREHLGATCHGGWGRAGTYASILWLIICLLLPSLATAQTEIKMSAVQKKKLDTFFSNFSESNLKSFKQNSLSQEAILNFALDHIYKNDYKAIKHSKDGNSAIIPAVLVDNVMEKYFGQKLKTHPKAEFLVPEASGETYVFSQISRLLGAGPDL
jgi:hypothetical protein